MGEGHHQLLTPTPPSNLWAPKGGRHDRELKDTYSNNFTSLSEEIMESELIRTISSQDLRNLTPEVGRLSQPYTS